MHKGTKLGPRDFWQTKINFCKREAYRYYKQYDHLQKVLSLKRQLAELEGSNSESEFELEKMESRLSTLKSLYTFKLWEFKKWSIRKKYGTKSLNFVAPYVEKYGEKAGFIYLIRTLEDRPLYKLGKTKNLWSRANSYNSDKTGLRAKPYEFVLVQHTEECDLIEKLLIEVFKDKVAKGNEWFWFSDEDIGTLRRYLKHAISNQK